MKLSDYIIKRLEKENIGNIFMVVGGAGMHIIDSIGKSKKITYTCTHHEQAALLSSEGYQRITGNLGVALVTTGPASTNAVTGVACAWNDSIPMLILSGQANSKSLIGNTGMRQRAAHEVNITKIVEPITKYAITILEAKTIKYHLEKAIYLAKNGRPGPCWLDIPLDIQCEEIDPETLIDFDPEEVAFHDEKELTSKTALLANWLKDAKRPVFVMGHGIRLSNKIEEASNLAQQLGIPIVHTKNGFDMFPEDLDLCIGQIGTYGKRAANFTVQNSDLIIFLGSRLAIPTVGYSSSWFGREAKIVSIDIDSIQQNNATIKLDLTINASLENFLPLFSEKTNLISATKYTQWANQCKIWKNKYPIVTPDLAIDKNYINSYYFFDVLSELMDKNDIMVADQGATFYCYSVAMKLKKGQRAYTNGGFSALGYGFPAAIGSCIANNKKRVISVNGDGGFQMNIQELQTVVHNKLPLKIFIFENQGYTSIKHTQQAYMDGFLVGSDPDSGLSCPDCKKIAQSYNIPSLTVRNPDLLKNVISQALEMEGPVIVEVILEPFQEIKPKVSSQKLPSGQLLSKPLEDMYPFLPREEFYENMLINPVKEKN